MNIITILIFFVMLWGLGHAATRLTKPIENLFEREFARIGIGLGVFSILAVLLNLLHVQLVFPIFVLIALISPAFSLKKITPDVYKIKPSKENIYFAVVIVLVLVNLFVFTKGAFSYPYLEDGDPWDHARSIRYIASEKTAFEPSTETAIFKFTDAYPPVYDILMAMLYQTEDDMIWVLKFFNSLLISLSIMFFFIFTKKFLNDPDKALAATFILFLIPSFMSHFIWAVTLAITLFFPCMYALESIKNDKKWMYTAGIMIAAVLISQPSMAVKLSIMIFLYWGVKAIVNKNWNKSLMAAGIIGITLSMIWWAPVLVRWGSPVDNEWPGIYDPGKLENQKRVGEFDPGLRLIGTADRKYTLSDFFFAPVQNMINNPIGLGGVIFFLLIISIPFGIFRLFKKSDEWKQQNEWKIIIFAWFLFTFLGIHGARLPIQFIAFRFWMLFAIPVSVLVGATLIEIVKPKTFLRLTLILLVLIGVVMTSGIPKYEINTSQWQPGGFFSGQPEELDGYLELYNTLPKHQKIFTICPSSSYKLAAFDQDECMWCQDEIDFKRNFLSLEEPVTAESLQNLMRDKGYTYFLVDYKCLFDFDSWEFQNQLGLIMQSQSFYVAHDFKGMFLVGIQ